MEHLHAIIEDAAGAVRSGEVIGVPTDTLYGLAADPFDQNALERIFAIKGRPGVKPLAVLVADLDQAQQIAAFSDRALDLAEEHWPGALTLVLPKLASVPAPVLSEAPLADPGGLGLERPHPRHPRPLPMPRDHIGPG